MILRAFLSFFSWCRGFANGPAGSANAEISHTLYRMCKLEWKIASGDLASCARIKHFPIRDWNAILYVIKIVFCIEHLTFFVLKI